jgi:hypothetical protein
MIDWEKTKQKYGYGKDELPPTSKKDVVWHCDNPICDAPLQVHEREYTFDYVMKKVEKAKAEGTMELCQTCSHKHRRGHVTEKREKTALPLPPEASDELTMQEYKYKASDLAPWSRKKIVLVCEDGSIHHVSRALLNTSKSVREFGHYYPISWWTQKRRTNAHVSEETKEQMKKSQQMRRQKEKDEKDSYYSNVVEFPSPQKKTA